MTINHILYDTNKNSVFRNKISKLAVINENVFATGDDEGIVKGKLPNLFHEASKKRFEINFEWIFCSLGSEAEV